MKSLRIFIIATLWALATVSFCHAGDYKIGHQQKACLSSIFYRLSGDGTMYTINRNECNRYGMLLLQDNLKQGTQQQEWIMENIWMVKRGYWLEKRQSMGIFVPDDATTAYIAILLEDEGMDLFRHHSLLNRPLFYQVTGNQQTALIRGNHGY